MFDKAYLFAILIIAILVVVVMYFSQSEQEQVEKRENTPSNKNKVSIPNNVIQQKEMQLEQMRKMIEYNEKLRQQEHDQSIQQLYQIDQTRQNEYNNELNKLRQLQQQYSNANKPSESKTESTPQITATPVENTPKVESKNTKEEDSKSLDPNTLYD